MRYKIVTRKSWRGPWRYKAVIYSERVENHQVKWDVEKSFWRGSEPRAVSRAELWVWDERERERFRKPITEKIV